MQLASHLYLVWCVLLLVVMAESITLRDHLNTTLASVEKCNKELNVTATVFVKNDRQVLIQLPAENNSSISSDETEERYIECLQNISELTTFTIFEDSPEVFSESHECQLSDATAWLERSGIDDPVVALPLDDVTHFTSRVTVKGLVSQLLYLYFLEHLGISKGQIIGGIHGIQLRDIF